MFEESLFCLANLIDAHVKHQDPTLQKLRNSVLSFWGEYLNLRNVNDSGARLCPGCSNLWTKMTTIHFKLIMIWNASTVLCTFIKLAMFYADLGYKHASLTWWPCVHGWGAVNTSTGMVRNERRVACHPYNNKIQRSLTILRENLLNTTTFEDNSYPKGRIVVNVFNRTVNLVHPVYIYIYIYYQHQQLVQNDKRLIQKFFFFFRNYCISNYKKNNQLQFLLIFFGEFG